MKPKIFCIAAIAIASTAFAPALAADKPSSQQARFTACAHESKGLKGDEHQEFMSRCLKGNGSNDAAPRKEASHKASTEGTQQSKMKTCNDAAAKKDLHGDERRAFMSSCLRG